MRLIRLGFCRSITPKSSIAEFPNSSSCSQHFLCWSLWTSLGWPGGASPPGIGLMEAGKGPGDAKLQPVGGTPTAENTTAYAPCNIPVEVWYNTCPAGGSTKMLWFSVQDKLINSVTQTSHSCSPPPPDR